MSTPPTGYGGTELVVAELAKGLRTLGHDVTVHATGDSRPAGRLRYHLDKPAWPPSDLAELRHALFAWRDIREHDYDVVHVHHAAALAGTLDHTGPAVLTLHHERVEALIEFYRDFPDVEFVAISERQRELSPEVPIRHVVHHGLDPSAYAAGEGRGGYVAFLGRFAKEKGPHVAIDAAMAAGVKLRMGGAPHEVARDFFDKEVAPRLAGAGERVEWLGELSHAPKVELLRDAAALVFPIQWEEPFGLVMIESMLVGTPVVALARGSAPEVVEDGITGFVARTEAELVRAIERVRSLDRARCRARARERWSHLRMALDYARVYEAAVERSNERVEARTAAPSSKEYHGAALASD